MQRSHQRKRYKAPGLSYDYPMIVPKVVHRPRNTRKPWVVRYEDGKGNQRETGFAQRRDAEDLRAKIDHDQRAGVYVRPDDRTTVAAYFERWITRHPGAPATIRTYRSMFNARVAPAIGRKPVGKVTRSDVTGLLRETMPRDGVGLAGIRTVRKLLAGMFAEALADGKVASNPAAAIRLPNGHSDRAEFYFPDHDELVRLADELEKVAPGFGVTVWLMRGCGLRPSEALAVRRADVQGGTLRVERQRAGDSLTGPLKGRAEGQYRDVPLPAFVAKQIESRKRDSGDLFPPMSIFAYERRFARAVKAAGLPGAFHPHALRHSYASALLHAGVPIFEVSRFLGHRSTDFTASVYGHLVPSAASRAREALDAEFK